MGQRQLQGRAGHRAEDRPTFSVYSHSGRWEVLKVCVCVVRYLDLSDELVVLVVLRVWEFINFDFVLLYLFHYLRKRQSDYYTTQTTN